MYLCNGEIYEFMTITNAKKVAYRSFFSHKSSLFLRLQWRMILENAIQINLIMSLTIVLISLIKPFCHHGVKWKSLEHQSWRMTSMYCIRCTTEQLCLAFSILLNTPWTHSFVQCHWLAINRYSKKGIPLNLFIFLA